MKIKVFKIIGMSLCLLALNCEDSFNSGKHYPPDNHEMVNITQGVWGNVWFWEGDFMPTTDNFSNGTITPVEREIYIHLATSFDSVIDNASLGGGFYDSILTRQVAKVNSNNSGFYQIELPPGKYSFFVKEGSLFYGNAGDSEGHIMSARVEADSVTKRQINITYNATF